MVTFVWAENGDKNKPDVMQKIEEHCNLKKNEVLELHRFWSVSYQSAQGFEQFLTKIRTRPDSCNFAEKDRMMRDKIVFSVTCKFQEFLLWKDKLDLQKCIKICRAFEQSNKHVQEIRDTHENTVHKINRKDE